MVQIGSKYTGKPAHHTDTQAGTYWEVLPTIEGQALALQRALTKGNSALWNAIRIAKLRNRK